LMRWLAGRRDGRMGYTNLQGNMHTKSMAVNALIVNAVNTCSTMKNLRDAWHAYKSR
jgi:hypothetical protein